MMADYSGSGVDRYWVHTMYALCKALRPVCLIETCLETVVSTVKHHRISPAVCALTLHQQS